MQQDDDHRSDDDVNDDDDFIDASLAPHVDVDQLFPDDGCLASLRLKPDHASRPLLVFANGHIILEAFSLLAEPAIDFLIAGMDIVNLAQQTTPTHKSY
jgi:hypothetical protein